ncbi:ACP S-malonyltransferase [candidate division KSB1 bacterium]|nr:ACP S-malonyltransferase [candidate division KSB1 bacterium]
MGKISFMYPGQASQYVGMGEDFNHAMPFAKQFYQQADDILGFKISEISFFGPDEKLKQTNITQPAILVHSVLITQLLKDKGIKPHIAAGHSLGEYSALVAADAIDFESALRIVKLRGELMHNAGSSKPGTMVAIIGLDNSAINEICTEARTAGIVQPANFNSPGQVVISGSIPGIKKATELAEKKGAKKIIPLSVSGAFHSPLMESAREELADALERIEIGDAEIPVYCNVTAEPIISKQDIKMALFKQLTHPVLWEQIIQNMIGDGTEIFYEVGPGRVLSGLLKRINRSAKSINVGAVDDYRNLT